MKRYSELDSLRGLAALTVVLSHYLLVFPAFEGHKTVTGFKKLFVYAMRYTPLKISWVGYESVLFFFILSGFVLSLQFLNNKKVSYSRFITKRICRIYLPLYSCILLTVIFRKSFQNYYIHDITPWFNYCWNEPVTSKIIIKNLILVQNFNTATINGVVWSLVHEMRISIIFPFLMIVILKTNWKGNLFFAFFLSSLSYYLIVRYHPTGGTNYFVTLHYAGIFVVGATMAKYRNNLVRFVTNFNRIQKYMFLLIGWLAYTYTAWCFRNVPKLHFPMLEDWIITLGAAIFIISAMSFIKVRNILLMKPISYLGKISYSVYLYNLVVELAIIYALFKHISIKPIIVISFVLLLILASLSYYLIEIPSIKLGQFISSKI